ncbi:MAG: hypothetical protein HPY76_09480 [Anaerolineae bacterium]|nr:hypothetical protein [Anaerolineae bacterium]
MRLTPPKAIVFWISVILGVVGIILNFVAPQAGYALWVVAVGWLLLVLGNAVKGF